MAPSSAPGPPNLAGDAPARRSQQVDLGHHLLTSCPGVLPLPHGGVVLHLPRQPIDVLPVRVEALARHLVQEALHHMALFQQAHGQDVRQRPQRVQLCVRSKETPEAQEITCQTDTGGLRSIRAFNTETRPTHQFGLDKLGCVKAIWLKHRKRL